MASSIPFKTAFGKRISYPTINVDESLTHQSFSAECDINSIMSKYELHGLLEHVNRHEGSYGDFVSASDYFSSVNQVMAANDMFSSLPSSLRERFSNDPHSFLAFVEDPSNIDEMRSLGLLKDPDPTPVVKPSDDGPKED